ADRDRRPGEPDGGDLLLARFAVGPNEGFLKLGAIAGQSAGDRHARVDRAGHPGDELAAVDVQAVGEHEDAGQILRRQAPPDRLAAGTRVFRCRRCFAGAIELRSARRCPQGDGARPAGHRGRDRRQAGGAESCDRRGRGGGTGRDRAACGSGCCGTAGRRRTREIRRGTRQGRRGRERARMTHEDIESTKAPLIEHLVELRSRLIKAAVAFLVMFIACFFFAKQIYNILTFPYMWVAGADSRFIYTGLLEYFIVQLKLAMFGAAFLSFPVVASQLYMFVAPGLYRNEKQAFLPYLVATPFFFLLGTLVVYF